MQQSYAVTSNSHQIVNSSSVLYEKSDIQHSGMVPLIDELNMNQIPKETRMKSSSLPSGLALNQLIGQGGVSSIKLSLSSNEELGNSAKIGRSKSNAQKKDSSDSDDNLILNEKQSYTERTSYHSKQSLSTYKSMDMKFSNVLVGELHKKFGSVSEDEEPIKSGNFETTKYEHKYRKNGEKRIEKSEKSENSSQNSENKTKHKELEDQEKHPNKKEESFFGRLLLRKSGKKTKKDNVNEKEDDEDDKKQSKDTTTFKNSHSDPLTLGNQKYVTEHSMIKQTKMSCSDQNAHKSIGQKVFSNQNHKRIDARGGYVNDPIIQESIHNYSKNPITEYGMNEMKHFSDKNLSETQYSQSSLKADDVNNKRLSSDLTSKNNSGSQSRLRQRVEPLDIPVSPELQRKPPVLPRSSIESKSFFPIINQGKVYPSKEGSRYIKNVSSPSKIINPNDEFQYPHPVSPKVKMSPDVSGLSAPNQSNGLSMDLITKPLSYSVSPPRTVWPHNYISSDMKSSSQGSLDHQSIRNSKIEYDGKFFDYSNQMSNEFDYDNSKMKPKIAGLSSYQQKISQIGNQIETDSDSPYSDSLNSRTAVTKSHSFRLNSDSPASALQQDMPSLPPMFGISESSIDSWETTYKKNLKENNDPPSSLELGSDSLISYTYKSNTSASNTIYSDRNIFIIPNVQGIQKDNLTSDVIDTNDQSSHYAKNVSRSKVRDTDISRIEANIDSIIGSPKPLNCVALKSNSLDSVKSFTEKSTEQRKAMSNESISHNKVYINQSIIPDVVGSVSFNPKLSASNSKTENIENFVQSSSDIQNIKEQSSELSSENHVSITVLNTSESSITIKTSDPVHTNKSLDLSPQPSIEKLGKNLSTQTEKKILDKFSTSSDPSVPEFMKIQLNKVDQKPATNVVLSTSVSLDNKTSKIPAKSEKASDVSNETKFKNIEVERSISYDPTKSEKLYNDLRKSESYDKNVSVDTKEVSKPQRKFSSEDVEILEKSDISVQNTSNSSAKRSGMQVFNKSNDTFNSENSQVNNNANKISMESKPVIPTTLSIRKTTPVSSLPPVSPTASKAFMRKKSETTDPDPLKRQSSIVTTNDSKCENNSLEKNNNLTVTQNVRRISSQELLADQVNRTDRSSSSSDDTNLESAVILRKKSMSIIKNSNKKDDEPELMKVFARRSLKLKDSESEALSQDILNIANSENKNEESDDLKRNSKSFNVMTRSRDSDKENEADSPKDERKRSVLNSNVDSITENNSTNKLNNKNFVEFRKHSSETAELMQAQRMPKKIIDTNPVSSSNTSNFQPSRSIGAFGSYPRSVSASVPLSQTTYLKGEVKSDFKKDTSDSTPEKRLRNRTFPDSNNENNKEDNGIKSNDKAEPTPYSIDNSSLTKRPWSQIKTDNDSISGKDSALKVPFRKSSFISTELKSQVSSNKFDKSESKDTNDKSNEIITVEAENETNKNETDGSPQFKGILQMRAEWERRAQQATTK